MRLALVALAAFAIAEPAHGQGARGTVRGVVEVARPPGVLASPILVYLVGFSEPPPASPVLVFQQDKHFIPDLVAVTVGQTVGFPNRDPLLHNVFSPTAERTFDLGSFDKGETRTRGFPKPGVIEIYCNIHPEMSATVVVVPNRKFVFASATGQFEIRDVPAGTWQLFAYSRRATRPVSATITVTANGVATTTLKLDEVKRDFTHANKYGETYRDDAAIYNSD